MHARCCGPCERRSPVGRSGREIVVDADPVAQEAMERVIAAAAEVLGQHIPDARGWCRGCLSLWGRLAPFPCEQAKWAAAVREAYTDPPD
jgi:hypothetical protein